MDDVLAQTETPAQTQNPVARFAADLRRLRLDAHSPTLAKLQSETGISRTVLSDAFAGRHLPSGRTVDGIVRACHGDPGRWLDRRDALAGAGAKVRQAPPEPVATSTPTRARTVSPRSAALMTAAGFGAGVVVGGGIALLIVPL